jgi:RNase adapter protein RapZ
VAVGCTGGKHRSVVLATELAGWLTDKGYRAHVAHRDVERE